MANRRLAQRLIDTITPGKSVREIRDTELRGFGIRVLPSGRKSFFVHAQNDGRRTWTKIGDASALPLADARDLARSSLAASRTGDQSRPSEIAAETPFEDIADAVFRRQSRHWKPGTLEVNRNYLKNQSLPRFRGQPIGAITGADVQEWFASLRSTPAADRAAPVLSVIMRDAETLGFRPEGTNPCGKIRRYRRRGRERFLSREETRRLGAVLKLHEGHVLAAAVKLLALTGCRKSEIMTLQWQDCRDGHLFLRDGKTGLRTVWLSSAARAVLDDLPRRSVWVFPGRACTEPICFRNAKKKFLWSLPSTSKSFSFTISSGFLIITLPQGQPSPPWPIQPDHNGPSLCLPP